GLLASVAFTLALRPFFGPALSPRTPAEVPGAMWIPPALLGLTALGLALVPGLAAPMVARAAAAIIPGSPPALELWHLLPAGPLALGLGSIALGALVFSVRPWARTAGAPARDTTAIDGPLAALAWLS